MDSQALGRSIGIEEVWQRTIGFVYIQFEFHWTIETAFPARQLSI